MEIGTSGAMKQTERLIEYGIMTEDSDIRAHVSAFNRIIYVFQTKYGVEAIERCDPHVAGASQSGVNGKITGQGWLVKPDWIFGMRLLEFPRWERWDEYDEDWSTTKRGRFAVDCVIEIMRLGFFPLWVDAKEEDMRAVQIRGTDILLCAKKRVQVKNDYPAGRTGNLFLQKAERNPFGRH